MSFDPDAFLEGVADGPMDTVIVPCPEGTFTAQVNKLEPRNVETKNGDRLILGVTWKILDDEVLETLERDVVTVRQDIWIDLDESGAIDTSKGKNVTLGRLREAVDQNETPKWRPRMLLDQIAPVKVRHRVDKNDPQNKFADVTAVTKAE